MSGDAQPKKRKDKRRRKEDEELFGHFKNPTDEVLHVQKEAGLGGNSCTKIIFFLLLAAIGVTVGLILVEYHGSTDADVVYKDDSPWNVAIKEWVEYLPVLPDILRGDTDDPHHTSGHSEGEHEEEEETEDDEHHVGGGTAAAGEGGGESWLETGQKWLNDLEIDFSFGMMGGDVLKEEEVPDQKGHGDEIEEEEDEVSTELNDDGNNSEENGADDEDDNEEEEEEEKSDELADETVSEEENDEIENELGDDRNDSKEEDDDRTNEDDADAEEEEDLSLEDLGRELEEEAEEKPLDDEEEESSIEEESPGDNESKEQEEPSVEEESPGDNESKEEESPGDNESKEEEEPSIEEESPGDNESKEEEESEHFSSYRNSAEPNRGDSNEDDGGDDDGDDDEGDAPDETHSNGAETRLDTATHEASEEELFPEAIEALKKEASELLRAQAEAAEENVPETVTAEEADDDPTPAAAAGNEADTETEGTEANQPIVTEARSSKEESFSTEVPTFEAPRVPAYTTAPPQSAQPPSSREETVTEKVFIAPSAAPVIDDIVRRAEPEEVSDDEQEEEEEEEEEEVELEGDDIDEEIGLSPKRYQELIAKYGQPTPESSDIEQSDDEPVEHRQYSDGGEAESVGEEESMNELEESEPDEDVEACTKVDKSKNLAGGKPPTIEAESEDEEEDEEEEEEEESEDEPPPLPKKPVPTTKPAVTGSRGGPKDIQEDYPNAEITNTDDWAIREELDLAEEEFNFDRIQSALDKFSLVLAKQPKSPRALYGFAKALDLQAEARSSNPILDRAIEAYTEVIRAPGVPDELFRIVAERLINRLRFRGQHMKAVPVHRELIGKFNNSVQYINDLAINYLMVNRLEDAAAVFKEALDKWPEDATARSHYGLVLKLQGKMKDCIPHLLAGISSDDQATRDARLYFHLGDALTRTGKSSQAMAVYMSGVEKGLFRSKYQRSLYNVERLSARPWWTHQQTTYQEFFKRLEQNWKAIRDEGLSAMKLKGLYQDEAESLRDVGDWKQFELFARGVKFSANCKKAPFTCSLIEAFPPARTCKRGQTKFSVMTGGTHVWPHCGPTNCRLRAHLGLVVPAKEKIAIRVADEIRGWEDGQVFVFDDSFEHEVWHNGTSPRLVLIVDVWHPELTAQEFRTLSPI